MQLLRTTPRKAPLSKANGLPVMLEPLGSFGLLSESPSGWPEYPTSETLDSLGARSVGMYDDDKSQASRHMLLNTFGGPQTIAEVFAGRAEKGDAE
ncbi:hypothetical protein FA13DRAFT_233240 [Coprinellus micaceus]|uniref:Uncharacterized protein n=1 Tax=Coprinellus micaceus TaxID=71717 RepID=A0A4Y7TG79_COPMI|nr:hypothetical protein FA13DRAFT_233240 [Coprinellus micaceus]